MRFAVLFDQRSGNESHDCDGQELSQRPPGEDVIHGGDLGEEGARTDANEVVGDQTWRREQQLSEHYYPFGFCFVYVV